MRKSVELGLENLLSFFFLAFFLPLITLIGSKLILYTTDYFFLFVIILVYSLNVTIQNHLIKFMIDNKAAAHFVEIFLNMIEITVVVYGYFKSNIEPQYVYYTRLFFPFPGVTWMIYLGQIASNKNI